MEQTTKTLPEERIEERDSPARTTTPTRDFRLRRSAWNNPRVRLGVVIGSLIVVVAALLLWRYFSSYESTDDAQIDGHVNSISARISGHVAKLNVTDNQYVQAGTVLVEIDPTDYQLAVDRARADYEDAQAAAHAATENVPMTSISTTSQLSSSQADVENARAGINAAKQQFMAAKAQLQQAEANNAKAQNDLARYQQLVDKQEI